MSSSVNSRGTNTLDSEAITHSYRGAKDRGILLKRQSLLLRARNFPLNVKNRNIIEIKVKNDIHLLERKISDLQIIP